eukprot:scaffold10684_cov58-Skeletonema_marinoi.AAC.1
MPEYCVPYALHLLAFRHETASAAGTLAGEDDSDAEMEADELAQSEEASEKRLKKRLKFLFDPLIQSLGERADNVSAMSPLFCISPPLSSSNIFSPCRADLFFAPYDRSDWKVFTRGCDEELHKIFFSRD